jgi:urease accessory protein
MGHGANGDVALWPTARIGPGADRARPRLIPAGLVSIPALLLSDSRFPAGGHAHSGGVEPAVTAGTVSDLASLEAFLRGRLRTAGLVAAGLAAAACMRAGRTESATTAETDVAAVPGPDRPIDRGSAPGNGDQRVVPGEGSDFWGEIDAEADARTPSPAQRAASRRQGRALLRAARVAWPDDGGLAALAASGAASARSLQAAADARTAGGTTTGRTAVGCAKAEYRGGAHHAVVLGVAAAAAGCDAGDAARIAAYQSVAGPASAAVRLLALDPMRATAVLARLAPDIDHAAELAAAAADGPLDELPCPSAPALDLLAEAHIRAEVRLFES